MTDRPCRCAATGGIHHTGDFPGVCRCGCPDYRPAETRDTLTARGTEPDEYDYALRNAIG